MLYIRRMLKHPSWNMHYQGLRVQQQESIRCHIWNRIFLKWKWIHYECGVFFFWMCIENYWSCQQQQNVFDRVLFRFTSPVQRAFGPPGNCQSCRLCAAEERLEQQGYSCGKKKTTKQHRNGKRGRDEYGNHFSIPWKSLWAVTEARQSIWDLLFFTSCTDTAHNTDRCSYIF